VLALLAVLVNEYASSHAPISSTAEQTLALWVQASRASRGAVFGSVHCHFVLEESSPVEDVFMLLCVARKRPV